MKTVVSKVSRRQTFQFSTRYKNMYIFRQKYCVMFVCLLNGKSSIPLTILRAKENRGLLSEMKGKGGRENDGVPDAEGG